MVEMEQVVRWLEECGEAKAAELAKTCSLSWVWRDTLFELGGQRTWEAWDVNIGAPAQTLKLVRENQSALGGLIENAIHELGEADGSTAVHGMCWVPRPKPAPKSTEFKQSVTEVTRRAIIERLSNCDWWGRLKEGDFLSRLYDLDALPSEDSRFRTAAGDIWQHRVNNRDWESDWVFFDRRFKLLDGSDQSFLKFLCETVHPVVRPDTDRALALVNSYNEDLRPDGWELVRSNEVSGHPTFQARQCNQEVEVFEEPTGWPKVDRQIDELLLRFREAANEEQFQSVGHLCRETLISVAQVVYDPQRHPTVDGVEPSATDAKRMLEAFINVELTGGSHESARKHAKASLELANDLQHRRNASFRDAALCTEATMSVVRIAAILAGRRERTHID